MHPLPAPEPGTRTERPWGWFETLCEQSGSKIKRIGVHPGQQISLQRHRHRAEHWVVLRGTAPDLGAMVPGAVLIAVLLPLSYAFFKRAESYFADVI